MRTRILFIVTVGLSVLLSSCEKIGNTITPSGKVTTETMNFTGYNALDVSHAFNVYVSYSSTVENIEIEANENLHQYIIVEKQGDKLIIKLKDRINIRNNATLNAYITTGYLSDFYVSGASGITLEDPWYVNNMNIELSGASRFSGEIETQDIYSDISGASNLILTGKVDYMYLDASGASNLKDYGLKINHFEGDLSGASNAWITVNNELDVDASGASNVYYKGKGTIDYLDLSGASNVKKMD